MLPWLLLWFLPPDSYLYFLSWFPFMMDCDWDMWAKWTSFSPSCFSSWYFYHSKRKQTKYLVRSKTCYHKIKIMHLSNWLVKMYVDALCFLQRSFFLKWVAIHYCRSSNLVEILRMTIESTVLKGASLLIISRLKNIAEEGENNSGTRWNVKCCGMLSLEHSRSDYLKNTCTRLGMSTFANGEEAHDVPVSSLKMYRQTLGVSGRGSWGPAPSSGFRGKDRLLGNQDRFSSTTKPWKVTNAFECSPN